MKNLIFRTLFSDEIDVRVSQITQKGLFVLLYKDARVDMILLDETVGPLNWQKAYTRDNRNCIVSIYDDEKKQWISKEDTGTESNMEAEKGLASDSFKRACFNFGIGRELYTAPKIWIPSDKCNIKQGNNGKLQCYDKFTVDEIQYDAKRRISYLTIKNGDKIVYSWGKKVQQKTDDEKKDELKKILKENEIPEDFVAELYKREIDKFPTKLLDNALKHIEDIKKTYLDTYKKFLDESTPAEFDLDEMRKKS